MREKITTRQLEILSLYNQGYTRRQASLLLQISESTYAWHLRKIRVRFGVNSRQEMQFLEAMFATESD
jgi:DNA-binding CsgD family transcriptional regulator